MSRRKGHGARTVRPPEPPIHPGPPPALAGSTTVPEPGTAVPTAGTPVSPAPATVPIRPAMLRFRCHADGNVRLVSQAEVDRDSGVWCPMCGNQMVRDPWA